MKKSILSLGLIGATLIFGFGSPNFSFAGTAGGGGGELTEIQMKGFLNRLVDYLSSAEGKAKFQEVVQYDKSHPNETIEDIASNINPVLIHEPVYYNGTERTCVSESTLASDGKTIVRDFRCNIDKLPQLPASDQTDAVKSVYYLYVYQMNFHEVLVQAGIEDQLQEMLPFQQLPSNYQVSSRLQVRVAKDWIPGDAHVGCPDCTTVPTDLLNRPLKEALKFVKIKLRQKKEIYLDNYDSRLGSVMFDFGSSGNIRHCGFSTGKKYLGKKIACTNQDGSPRGIEISKAGVNLEEHWGDVNFPISSVLTIQTDLPLKSNDLMGFDSFKSAIGVINHLQIDCQNFNSNEDATVGDLISALSEYYEVVGIPSTEAPSI